MSLLEQRRRALLEGLLSEGLRPEPETALDRLMASYLRLWTDTNALQKVGMTNVPIVSDVAGLLGDVQQYVEQPEQRTGLNYALSGLGLLPFMPAAFGTFKGINANLSPAETEMLQKAFELEQQGLGREAIRQATNPPGGSGGWFRDPTDLQWKMEIDDSAAVYQPGKVKARIDAEREKHLGLLYDASVMRHWMEGENLDIGAAKNKYVETFGKEPNLGSGLLAKDVEAKDLLDRYKKFEEVARTDKNYDAPAEEYLLHPELYRAYPSLAKTNTAMSETEPFTSGSFSRGRGVELNPAIGYNLDTGRSTILHELGGHGVQDLETFSRGSNPGMFAKEAADAQKTLEDFTIASAMRSLIDDGKTVDEAWRGIKEMYPDAGPWVKDMATRNDAKELESFIQEAGRRASSLDPYKKYLSTGGEAWARLIEARRFLTPELRSAIDPIEQMNTMLRKEGFPNGIDDLTNRFGDGPAMSQKGGLLDMAYRGEHRPMQDAGGAARLHDLTAAFPEDVYGKQALQFYGSGDPRERGVLKVLHGLRGKPDAKVKIYRGVPKDAGDAINAGDWVTLDRNVAADYGDKVIEMEVPAADVTAWGDSLLEFGYWPK